MMKLALAITFIGIAPCLAFSQTEDRETAARLLAEASQELVPYRAACRCCIVDPDGPCCSGSCNIIMSARLFPASGRDALTPNLTLGFRDFSKTSPRAPLTSNCLATHSIETCLGWLRPSVEQEKSDAGLKPPRIEGNLPPADPFKKKALWPPANLAPTGLTISREMQLK
jgi:hypothetical protein